MVFSFLNYKEAGVIWCNRWLDFFINIPKTLNWQFSLLYLEFSSTQRKSFFRYYPICNMAAPNMNGRLHLTGVRQKPPASLILYFLLNNYAFFPYFSAAAEQHSHNAAEHILKQKFLRFFLLVIQGVPRPPPPSPTQLASTRFNFIGVVIPSTIDFHRSQITQLAI